MPTKTPACRVLPGILLVLLAIGRPAAAAEPQSWPMPEWTRAAPGEVGMDAALLEKARDYALRGEGSGYVTRHGKLVFSWGDPKRLYDLKSSTKSFGAAAPAVAEAHISLAAPQDGGTPRDPARITAVGPREFRVRACAEEGQSRLTHAVSRMDLVCRNAGSQAETVTLHVDLSGDGSRKNYDSNEFGGTPTRDFLFIQPPRGPWRQVNGRTEGWVSSVTFSVPRGETKVGLSPWYTYGDYLRFVQTLPEHAHLRKALVGRSDGGREHWELTITDAAVPAEKKRSIYWQAREHACESFSSLAMEGAVAYLLSDEAAGARRQFVFTLHPMGNVDGVAQGYEYRSGYDYPDPRGTASGRLVFDAVDRLRQAFVIAWHNWIAPCDVDSLFYTDGDGGRAVRRGWDLFTQRFPSPRAAGHRWQWETDPLKQNWFGRTLSEGNVHQYALKRYGSRVWGWEMPWWNRDEAGAREAGAAFARAFLATAAAQDAPAVAPAPEAPVVEVPRWEMHEWTLRGRSHVANPYRDAALVGEFTSPSGKTVVLEGFFDGEDVWRLRFAPNETGDWRYLLRGEGVELSERGRLRCVAPRGSGFIHIHPQNPYAFARDDGTAFFPMGDTCYGLYDDSHITPALRQEYLETRRRQRFNFVRMSVGHSEFRAASDSAFWAWGGTPDKPDLDRLNPVFFRGLDGLMRDLQGRGMNVEVLLLNFYRRPFTDTSLWTAARERLWLRYVVARYTAFTNVFLWALANEYETHPDGRYRLDRPGDVEWAVATARLVKQSDPYRHPVTVHPVVSSSTQGQSPRDPFDPPWRIGGFFGEGDAFDVLSQQTSAAYAADWDGRQQRWVRSCTADPPDPWFAVQWDESLSCWTGDVPGVSRSVAADRVYRKPVINTESGYEYLRGASTEGRQVHHTDKVRRTVWRIVCAGGYFAAGFNGTLGHSDAWERKDAPRRYPFVVKDEGAAGQMAVLYDFFTALPFGRMHPWPQVTGEAVALAAPGGVYILYLPHGGRATLDLGEVAGTFTARWFDPRRGTFGEPLEVRGGGPAEFTAPDSADWALLLERAR